MGEKLKKDMSFLQHLEEFRWHIIRSLLVVVAFSTLGFIFKHFLFDTILIGPSTPEFITNRWFCDIGHRWTNSDVLCMNVKPIKLQSIEMAGQFLAHIKISMIAGLILATPYVIYELWRFIGPALYTKERNVARGAILAISLLFFIGVAFGYYLIVPMSVNWLVTYQVSPLAENNIMLMSYVSSVTSICMGSGICFELPVVIYFLTKIGVVTPAFLRKYRRHAIIVILIIGAIITPPDVFSQVLVSIPLYLLFEGSILMSVFVARKKAKLDAKNVN